MPDATPAAEVVLPPEVVWQLSTKGLSPAKTRVSDSEALAEAALRLVAVMT